MNEEQKLSIEDKQSVQLERVEFKNSKGLTLVGDLRKAITKTIIIMSHGLGADRHEKGVFDKTADHLSRSGYNVLNFDFSGSGESQGEVIKPSLEIDDLISAIDFAKRRGFDPIALLGLSFGGYVTIKAFPSISDRISAVVLWSPVTHKKEHPEARYLPEQQKELLEKGRMTRIDSEMVRKTLYVDREFFDVWRGVNQEEILSSINLPVLIVHGDADEVVPVSDSQSAIQYLPKDSRLDIVPGVGHGSKIGDAGLIRFIESTDQWIKEHLPR